MLSIMTSATAARPALLDPSRPRDYVDQVHENVASRQWLTNASDETDLRSTQELPIFTDTQEETSL
jgi:hypothetical protein